MKRKAILLGVLSIFVAGQASAKILDTWTRISLQFTNLARAGAADTGIGVSTLNTSGSGMHLNTLSFGNGALSVGPASGGVPGLSLNTIIPVTDPLVSNGGIVSVRLTNIRGRSDGLGGYQGAPNILAPISGAVQSTTSNGPDGLGTVPVSGMVRICLVVLGGCPVELLPPIPVGATMGGIAFGGAAGGILTAGGLGMIRITVLGAPYTVKTITAFNRTDNGNVLQTFTEKGFAHGPMSMTSSTGQTSGVLQVVSVNHTSAVGTGGADISGQFSRILVHFIPEPGLLLLLGSGAAGMALLGRKRIRK